MSSGVRRVLWTVVGYGLVLGAVPLMILAPLGTVFAVCVIAGVGGCLMVREGLSARRWIRVPGRVTRSELVQRTSQVDSMENERAEIEYVYEVEGRSYRGDRVRAAKISGESRGLARKRLQRYPVGAAVQVYVRPEEPTAAMLEPGVPAAAWLLLGAWIFAALAAAHWFDRHGASPASGWLDAVPSAAALLVAALSRLTREKQA